MKERHHDALHDGRSVGAADGRGLRLGTLARRGVRGVPGGARCAVSAGGAAQGPADPAPPAGSLAGGARCRARGAAPAPQPLGAWSVAAAATVAGLLVFRPFGTGQANAADLASIKRESATLEQQLERYDPDARVMSGRAAAVAAALEDRIAVIDGELARFGPSDAQPRPAELVKLSQQRVDIMQQLVGVHVTRAAYVGL